MNLDQKINDTKPFIWSCLSINFRFSGRFSKPTKTINKDLSHNNTVSVGLVGQVTTLYARDLQFIQTLLWSLEFVIQINLKHDTSKIQFFSKTSSFKTHLTQHKKFTPVARLKTLPLYKFPRKPIWLVPDKTLALHHFYAPKNCIFKALRSKCLYIPVNLHKNIFVTETGSFYSVGGG